MLSARLRPLGRSIRLINSILLFYTDRRICASTKNNIAQLMGHLREQDTQMEKPNRWFCAVRIHNKLTQENMYNANAKNLPRLQ